ncbi:hypothetical protein [Rugamonas rivuli]|nr:hypothetical protein [Rugamonas rivuli]
MLNSSVKRRDSVRSDTIAALSTQVFCAGGGLASDAGQRSKKCL